MISQGHIVDFVEPTLRTEADRHELADLILQRAEWLDPADRALIEQVFGRGGSTREMAAILQVNPRTVQRRIRTLVARLTDPTVLIVLRQHRRWEHTLAAVALAYWVRRLSMQQIARERNMTMFEVRQQLQFARGLIAAESSEKR